MIIVVSSPLRYVLLISASLLVFFSLANKAEADGIPDNAGFVYNAGTYSVVSVPALFAPSPFGINNLGQIVGSDGNENIGFLYQNGNSTLISPTINFSTRPVGINDSGVIVGNEAFPGSQGFQVFLDHAGSFTTLTVPSSALATGINNAGQVVGWFGNSVFTTEAFLYTNGSYSTFNAPGATSTNFYGISNSGQIVGEYFNNSGEHVFVLNPKSGIFTPINVPCGTTSGGVGVTGINNSDEIVGNCKVGNGVYSGREFGFEYNYVSGHFTPVFFPLSYTQDSFVTGINDNGQVVGFYNAPEPGSLVLLIIGLALLIFAYSCHIRRATLRAAACLRTES
jgi:probable HAF family extracellular repeat protein